MNNRIRREGGGMMSNVIWTEDELEFLINNWRRLEVRELAGFLGRSVEAIYERIHALELEGDDE